MKRTLPVAAALFAAFAACHKPRPQGAGETALALVEGARTGAIERGLVDEELIARIRRVERYQGAAHAHVAPDVLAKVWATPLDRGLTAEEKSRQLRERAAAGLRRSLHGKCDAAEDAEAARRRVEALVTRVDNATDDATAEMTALGRDLAAAKLIKVNCDDGAVGLLLIPSGAGFRVVDIFPLGGLHMPFQNKPGTPPPPGMPPSGMPALPPPPPK